MLDVFGHKIKLCHLVLFNKIFQILNGSQMVNKQNNLKLNEELAITEEFRFYNLQLYLMFYYELLIIFNQ